MSDNIVRIGHNNPPSPFEERKAAIEDLYAEAKQWLDGEKVTTQEQADALNTLEASVRRAAKAAEEARKTEAKPFDDGKAEVQARYKPILSKADEALAAIKAALKPYLLELDRQQQEAARLAREEADRKRAEALAAIQERDNANLAEREAAEALVAEAKKAEEAARRAEKEKAHAKGEGRATGLRTVKRAVLADERAAAAWVWQTHRADLIEFVQNIADKALRAGFRDIPGFTIVEEKVL